MPNYVTKALEILGNRAPPRPQHSLNKWVPITYGKQIQSATVEDTTPLLTPLGIKHIQQVVGSFLYYARAIDNTIHPALNTIGSQQAKPTETTNNDANALMDYLFAHPAAKLRFIKSDMQLHVDSNASFLVILNERSRIAG